MAGEEKKTEFVLEGCLDLLSVEEAAAYLKFSRNYIYKLAGENKIPHTVLGRHLIFRKIDLFNWIGSLSNFVPETKGVLKWI